MLLRVLFPTAEYGDIEVSRDHAGTCAGEAYVRGDDILVDVDENGHFCDLWGRPFRVHWPVPHTRHQDAWLEVVVPRAIARTSLPA